MAYQAMRQTAVKLDEDLSCVTIDFPDKSRFDVLVWSESFYRVGRRDRVPTSLE